MRPLFSRPAAVGVFGLLFATGCNQTTIQTPTRSLDRPSDVALVCAIPAADGKTTVMTGFAACNQNDPSSGGAPLATRATLGQLFALVANTGRGEVALAATSRINLGAPVGCSACGNNESCIGGVCTYVLQSAKDVRASDPPQTFVRRAFHTDGPTIVDLDPSTPGYGFLPVGGMPEHVRASKDGCRAVTANADSCDLAEIRVLDLLRIQTGERPRGAFPSEVVRRVQPHLPGRPDRPLRARPTWIELTPATSDLRRCLGPSSQSCGRCGVQTRTCKGGDWSPWSACTNEGVCSPGEADASACQAGAMRTCTAQCQYSTCSNQTCAGSASEACGSCGVRTRTCDGGTWSVWSACMSQGVCAPGTADPDAGACGANGTRTCTAQCQWSGCSNPTTTCDRDQYHVFVAYPTCELVAEIDLRSGDITQAIRVTRDGAFPVDDLGRLDCPVECAPVGGGGAPAPLDLGPPRDAAPVDAAPDAPMGAPLDAAVGDGSGAVKDAGASSDGAVGDGAANDALPPLVPTTQALPSSFAVDEEQRRLIVGDAASARITTIALDASDRFLSASSIFLTGTPGGVERVRLSQRIVDPVSGDPGIRYLYAIARDRTIRVLDADHGAECETNPDVRALDRSFPLLDPISLKPEDPMRREREMRCLPVGSLPRSPLATSPGISLVGGALPRDVLFAHQAPILIPPPGQMGIVANPATLVGEFAWAVDSTGRLTAINVEDRCPQPNDPGQTNLICDLGRYYASADPMVTRNLPGRPVLSAIELMPNRIRGSNSRFIAPSSLADPLGAPRLVAMPVVSASGVTADPNRVDHPNLCDVPSSYSRPDAGVVAPVGCTQISPSGAPGTAPQVLSSTGFISFSDPQALRNEGWTLEWEATLPGTSRAGAAVAGRTLGDTGAANCFRGVLAGDKAFLVGCGQDGDCGVDQQCYIDPGSPDATQGLCIRRGTTAEAQQRCQPWTRALRRYRISRAAPTELTLDELPEPEHPIDTVGCASDADCSAVVIPAVVDTNAVLLPTRCLADWDGASRCLRACSPGQKGPAGACGVGYVCGASRHGDTRCMRAPLPPERGTNEKSSCFGESQIYEVHAGEAFLVRGDQSGVLSGGYEQGGGKEGPGTCAFPTDPVGRLRVPRIPISPGTPPCSSEIQNNDWLAPLPVDLTTNVCRLDTSSDPGNLPARPIFARFSNPFFDLVVYIPSRTTVAIGSDGGVGDGGALAGAVTRSPADGTVISFSVVGGFHSLSFTLGTDIIAQLPRAMTLGPDGETLYIVDEGKQTVASGLRGQLLRFFPDSQITDSTFLVR